MKNPLKHPLFIISAAAYFVLFIMKKNEAHVPLVSDYLADVLALPVVLAMSTYLMRRLTERKNFRLEAAHIIFAFVFFAVFFEGIAPMIDSRFTADLLDVPAYAIGGIMTWFFRLGNREQEFKNEELGD